MRCGDGDCRSSESLSRLDRWHLGQIAMSNNEMRLRMISNRDEETKVVSSVTGDSRDGGGSPKLCDSFSGNMAMVAASAVIGDLGLGFD
ncbi:hypothetical protein TIFTF001_025347 [Ficus carica]|uniref:Uncharacterized protein n=1 Tax=Ficus carica TaxID=3494 RepID=A0AA88B1C4_FICCA|nr:hypothetical protein TIFTF001_025347 [Ficus carica]